MEEPYVDYDYDFSEELTNGIVDAINNWYVNNELRIIIVEGYQGVGKSLYSLLIASEVYKTNSWNVLKKYYVYDPTEFLDTVKSIRKKRPLLVWDDAGNWLNSQDYNKKRVVDTCKYFQVARPHWGCILLTAVDAEDIVSRIRNMPNRILIQVIKNSSKKEPDRRTARVFTRWKSPDKTRKGEAGKIDENFYLHNCSPELYKPYEKYRLSFVNKAIKEMDRSKYDD